MKLVKTEWNNLTFYYKSDDVYIGQSIARGSYEPYFTRLLLKNIRAGDTVVDIGANIGFDTINMAKKVGKSGRVYSIEPENENFEILKKNIGANNLKNVMAIKAAIGGRSGFFNIYKSKENYGDHKLYEDGSDGLAEWVEVKTLDSMIKEFDIKKVNLIKSDTQGYEPAVLGGGLKTLKRDGPIMFFEYWPGGYKKADLDYKKMEKMLKQIYGENIFYIDEYIQVYYKRNLEKIDRMLGENEHCNLWVKKDIKWLDRWRQVSDFWPKKFIKRGLGFYPLT